MRGFARRIALLAALPVASGCGASSQSTGPVECPEPTPVAVAETEEPPPVPAAVVTAEEQDKRAAPNGRAWITILGQGNEAFLGRLELAGGASVPEHQDPTEEYIHVLSGSGTLTIDGEEHEIGPGTTVLMPAGSTVSYQNGPERLVAIQVFAGPEPASKYDTWQAAAPTAPASDARDEAEETPEVDDDTQR